MVKSSILGISYIGFYVVFAVAGSVAFVNLALLRLFATRRPSDRGKITTPPDIEAINNLTLLGEIPNVEHDGIQDLFDRRSIISEAYFNAAAALSLSTKHGAPRSILVTSTKAGEGKSTTALGLAIGLAANGKHILLIDADMRRPSQHS